jgi:hypothetical protein
MYKKTRYRQPVSRRSSRYGKNQEDVAVRYEVTKLIGTHSKRTTRKQDRANLNNIYHFWIG